MMRVVSLLLAPMILAVAGAAAAQMPVSALELESSSRVSSCVKPGEAPLKYPPGMIDRKLGGIVRVRLTFFAADKPPRTEVFYDTVGNAFRDAVLDHVASYRLPCLRHDDPPAVMTQEFVFSPLESAKVFWYPLRNEPDAARRNLASCLTGADNVPAYPYSRVDAVENGSVLARFTFIKPDQPPTVEILFDGGSPRFARYVDAYATRLRLPCLPETDSPLKVIQHFSFVMEGTRRSTLRNATLAAFVPAIDKIENERVRFDFRTMGCPFDVRFQLRQPVLPNAVGEVERSDPNRREFLEWLRGVKLKLSAEQRRNVIGDSMTISVPCGELDLS